LIGFIKKLVSHVKFFFRNGFTNSFLKMVQSRRFHVEILTGLEHEGTSITDGEYTKSWPSFAHQAHTDTHIFNKFRRSHVLIEALDHVSLEDAKKYLIEIEKMSNFRPEFKEALRQLDSLGKPIKFWMRPHGLYSSTSIRYLKVYLDLNLLFGNLDSFRIVEIGVGFGGQAQIISSLSNPSTYTLLDLPPVLELSKKILDINSIGTKFDYLDGRNPVEIDSDLVISNYAFSELNKVTQNLYLERVLLNAKRGYVTWNNLSEKQLGGISLAELIREIPNSQILPEVPLTHPGNCIVWWKNT
jgi:putative sugar O-methyltransferase